MNVYALNADMLVRAAASCSTEIFNWSLYLQALPILVYLTWRTSMPCRIASCNETSIKRLLGLHSKSVYVHGGGGQFQHKPNTLSTITTIHSSCNFRNHPFSWPWNLTECSIDTASKYDLISHRNEALLFEIFPSVVICELKRGLSICNDSTIQLLQNLQHTLPSVQNFCR